MRRHLVALLPLCVMVLMSAVIRRWTGTDLSLWLGVLSYVVLLLALLPQARSLKPWVAAPRWPGTLPVPLPALALMLWGVSVTLQTLLMRSGLIPGDTQGLNHTQMSLTSLLLRLGLLGLLISEELVNVSTLRWLGESSGIRRLPEPLQTLIVVTASAAVFGFMHALTYNPAAAVLVFAGHLPYLLATWKTRNLWPALTGHIFNNATVFASMYSTTARMAVLGTAFGITALWLILSFRKEPRTIS